METLKNLPADMWSKITKIDELKGQWAGGVKLSPQVLGRLQRSVLITSTGASTRIEGARLSDEDIEKLMRGISMQKFRERDTQVSYVSHEKLIEDNKADYYTPEHPFMARFLSIHDAETISNGLGASFPRKY